MIEGAPIDETATFTQGACVARVGAVPMPSSLKAGTKRLSSERCMTALLDRLAGDVALTTISACAAGRDRPVQRGQRISPRSGSVRMCFLRPIGATADSPSPPATALHPATTSSSTGSARSMRFDAGGRPRH
ncbi:hypothetical protein [Burkholderia alba]|uniref:hypothetical protein n=1 Tax=Burkholderia alba TaxID=2683677 RepID=UPI002B05EF3F|nr:hypothetical protein [Burkholderia alba]